MADSFFNADETVILRALASKDFAKRLDSPEEATTVLTLLVHGVAPDDNHFERISQFYHLTAIHDRAGTLGELDRTTNAMRSLNERGYLEDGFRALAGGPKLTRAGKKIAAEIG